ncbi:MAG: DUF1351 domain-containing protein [Clostridia bacterium]|nr:DUF1351 domain-containing protein [Clostridia bacterium]
MAELEIMTTQEPGVVSFDNFDEVKGFLASQLERYKEVSYSEEGINAAKADKAMLTKLKKAIDDRRKEIKKAYLAPYNEMEAKIKELLEMINEPLALINEYVNAVAENEKVQKRAQIRAFYDSISAPLGAFANTLFESAAFYDAKWENATTREKTYRDEIRAKIETATRDIPIIQANGGSKIDVLMMKYLETLSMDAVMELKAELDKTAELATAKVESFVAEEDNTIGYKIIKISGTASQMTQVLSQIALIGVEVEEIEDGMPREGIELTTPDFDSFVAFDIETSGTYGAANGDAPAEIIEIGAVKIIGGKAVEKFDILCDPKREITPLVAKLTHITNDMVKGQPSVDETICKFAEFVGELPLVGHNIASSDMHYILKAAKRAGLAIENPYFDTYRYAQKFKAKQGWANVKLEYLSEQFGISQPDAHRAWCDAEANVGVYFKLKEM